MFSPADADVKGHPIVSGGGEVDAWETIYLLSNSRKLWLMEHISENIIRNIVWWILVFKCFQENASRTFLFFSFSITSDSLLSSETFGRRENIARILSIWFLLYTVFLCDWSLPWFFFFFFRYFSRMLSYACRPSSIRYPFTQSLTHSRAHLPVAVSKKKKKSIANQSPIVVFLVTLYVASVIKFFMLTEK